VQNESNIIKASSETGVERIVKVSVLDARKGPVKMLSDHLEVEEKLKASGIAWTILRPNYYFQNLYEFRDSIQNKGLIQVPMRDGKISMVHVRNVAGVATSALIYDGHDGKTYDITGPVAVGFSEIADALGRHLGRTVEFKPLSTDEFKSLGAGPRDKDMGILYEMFESGEASRVTDTISTVGAVTPLTLDDFAIEFAEAD